ncbi:hypothetical protein IWZ00DRAFT_486815 [Phyllosticta capitalensis]|uniref:uncharacterized protein n=1 Tax=Phyllosticta capitalensis TaxID=121624 RepID=UPI00312EA174
MSSTAPIPHPVHLALNYINKIGADNLIDPSIQPRAAPRSRAESSKTLVHEPDNQPLKPQLWPHGIICAVSKLGNTCQTAGDAKALTLRHVHIRQNNANLDPYFRDIREVCMMDLTAALKEANAASTISEQKVNKRADSPFEGHIENGKPSFPAPKTLAGRQSLLSSRWAPKNQPAGALSGPRGHSLSVPKHQSSDSPITRTLPNLQQSNVLDRPKTALSVPAGLIRPVTRQSTFSDKPIARLLPDHKQSTSMDPPLQGHTAPVNRLSPELEKPISSEKPAALISPDPPKEALALPGHGSPEPEQSNPSKQSLQVPSVPRVSIPVPTQPAPSKQPVNALTGLFGRLSLDHKNSHQVQLPSPSFRPMDRIGIQFGDVPTLREAHYNVQPPLGASNADPRALLSEASAINDGEYKLLEILKSYIDRLELIELGIGPKNSGETRESAVLSYMMASVKLNDSTADLDASSMEALHANYKELVGFNRIFLARWRLAVEDSLRRLYEYFQEHSSISINETTHERIDYFMSPHVFNRMAPVCIGVYAPKQPLVIEHPSVRCPFPKAFVCRGIAKIGKCCFSLSVRLKLTFNAAEDGPAVKFEVQIVIFKSPRLVIPPPIAPMLLGRHPLRQGSHVLGESAPAHLGVSLHFVISKGRKIQLFNLIPVLISTAFASYNSPNCLSALPI